MKRFIALLLMLIAVSGCDWMYEPVLPNVFPPETGPVSHKLEVLDFYATWCGPCKLQAPRIKMLERDGYKITPVDVDKHEDKAKQYHIESVPTYVVLYDGKEEYRTQNAWTLANYLSENYERPVQTAKGDVRDLPQTNRQDRKGKAAASSEGTRTGSVEHEDDLRRTGEPKTVETCLIRDRHLYLND